MEAALVVDMVVVSAVAAMAAVEDSEGVEAEVGEQARGVCCQS